MAIKITFSGGHSIILLAACLCGVRNQYCRFGGENKAPDNGGERKKSHSQNLELVRACAELLNNLILRPQKILAALKHLHLTVRFK